MSTYYLASLLLHIKPLQNLMVSNNHLFAPIWQFGWGLVKPSISEPNDISLGCFYWSWRIHYKVIHSHGWQVVFHCQLRTVSPGLHFSSIWISPRVCLGFPMAWHLIPRRKWKLLTSSGLGFKLAQYHFCHIQLVKTVRGLAQIQEDELLWTHYELITLCREISVSPSLWIFI